MVFNSKKCDILEDKINDLSHKVDNNNIHIKNITNKLIEIGD